MSKTTLQTPILTGNMSNFPTVNPTDFHMQNYDSSIYSEIEEFCSKNEFTVDYFLQEFAQREQQLQRPFNAYRGRSALNDIWNKTYCFSLLQKPRKGFFIWYYNGVHASKWFYAS